MTHFENYSSISIYRLVRQLLLQCFQWFSLLFQPQLLPFWSSSIKPNVRTWRSISSKTSGWSAKYFLALSEPWPPSSHHYKNTANPFLMIFKSVAILISSPVLEILLVHDFHEGFKWRSYLVFHDLNLGFPTNVCILITSLNLSISNNIQTDRSIEFQGTATWCCFVISEDNPNFSRSWLIKMAIVFVLLIEADSLRMAWPIIRACKPTGYHRYLHRFPHVVQELQPSQWQPNQLHQSQSISQFPNFVLHQRIQLEIATAQQYLHSEQPRKMGSQSMLCINKGRNTTLFCAWATAYGQQSSYSEDSDRRFQWLRPLDNHCTKWAISGRQRSWAHDLNLLFCSSPRRIPPLYRSPFNVLQGVVQSLWRSSPEFL